MRSSKPTRVETASNLSRAVSIEEIVVDTVSEILGTDNKDIANKFSKSECCKRLFDFNTGYAKIDINQIVSDFLNEYKNGIN